MILLFIGIIAVITIVFFVIFFHEKKYSDFVEQNSIALKTIRKINQRYSFYPYVNFNQEHTYDNEDYYAMISCSDFLIYKLQDLEKDIYAQVKKVEENKRQYQKYLDDISSIQFGNFELSIGKLKLDKLLKKERSKVEQNMREKPILQFSITVTLYRSTMNGSRYDKKEDTFSVDEIFAFIKRLKNKSGYFYNDRKIWDALCRVERGKVSNKMRFSIYQRDGNRCRRCGVSGRYVKLEIDHIVPISKGGKSTYSNLQTLCHSCNYEKGNNLYY